jgi:hypothetical protein
LVSAGLTPADCAVQPALAMPEEQIAETDDTYSLVREMDKLNAELRAVHESLARTLARMQKVVEELPKEKRD